MSKLKGLTNSQIVKLTTLEADFELFALKAAGRLDDVNALARVLQVASNQTCQRAQQVTGYAMRMAVKAEPGFISVSLFPADETPPVFSDFSALKEISHE